MWLRTLHFVNLVYCFIQRNVIVCYPWKENGLIVYAFSIFGSVLWVFAWVMYGWSVYMKLDTLCTYNPGIYWWSFYMLIILIVVTTPFALYTGIVVAAIIYITFFQKKRTG